MSFFNYTTGPDWNFGNSDGGPGTIGTVLNVKQDGKVVVCLFLHFTVLALDYVYKSYS